MHTKTPAKIFAWLLAVLVYANSVLHAQQSTKQNLQQLFNSIEAIVQQDHVPGLMIAAATKDSLLFSRGFGYADIKNKRLVDGNTLFRLGSITKMFVSLAVLKLIQEYKLNLNDELKQVAPEVPFKNKWETTNPVRIVHLLEHTAGFDDMKLNRMCAIEKKLYAGKEMMLYQQSSMVCRWKPGERHAYSNPGYVILAYIIEKLTGVSYDKYITETILKPLGMLHSNFNQWSKLPDVDTRPYVVHKGKIIEVHDVGLIMAPAGALWSSANEMQNFIQLFLRNGNSIVTDSMITAMEITHSTLAAKAGLKHGYGLGNEDLFLFTKSPNWRGHSGLTGTCFSLFAYNRVLGKGFIMSSNGNQRNEKIENLLVNYLEQETTRKPLPAITTDSNLLKPWLGYYRFESPRNEIAAFKDRLLNTNQLLFENGALYLKPIFGSKLKLVETAPQQFAFENANSASIVLAKNDAGILALATRAAYYEQASPFSIKADLWIKGLAILLTLTAVLAGFVALVKWMAGRLKLNIALIQILPMLGIGLLVWAIMTLLHVQEESYLLSELTFAGKRSLIVFIGTLTFGIFAMLHPFLVFANFRRFKRKWAGVYWILVSIALVYIAAILFLNGWIGMRTWAI